jgi:hypothetical protein
MLFLKGAPTNLRQFVKGFLTAGSAMEHLHEAIGRAS